VYERYFDAAGFALLHAQHVVLQLERGVPPIQLVWERPELPLQSPHTGSQVGRS
jgi:hypothetical protein